MGPDDALSFPSGHTFGTGVFLLVLGVLAAGARQGPDVRRSTSVLAFSARPPERCWSRSAALPRLPLADGRGGLDDGLAVAVTGIVVLVDGLRRRGRQSPAA